MPTLVLSSVIAVLFALVGGLIWLILFLFKKRGHGRRTAKYTGIAYLVFLPLALFILFPLLVSQLIANASTRPQDQQITQQPSDFGRAFEEVRFTSSDGVELSGWFLPGEATKPTILFTHGLFRNRFEVLERTCRLNALGYPALVFDLRNHGRSSMRQVTLGGRERLDVLAAKAFLLQEKEAEGIVLAGVSLGAVACIGAAQEDLSGVAALVIDSPFDTLRDTVGRHIELFLSLPRFPFTDVFLWNIARVGEFKPDSVNQLTALSDLGPVPVLLIYGSADERMPKSVAEQLYNAAATPQKELIFFEGAGHGAEFRTDPERYVAVIDQFLRGVSK